MVEVRVDTQASAAGMAYLCYMRGDHGFCATPVWAACPVRMACLTCDDDASRDVADQIAARDSVRRFLEKIPLTDDELAAAEGAAATRDELIEKNKHLPSPRPPFARPATACAGRPRPVIQAAPMSTRDGCTRGATRVVVPRCAKGVNIMFIPWRTGCILPVDSKGST